MKAFAIFDREQGQQEEIGYLFCYEKKEEYVIELDERLDCSRQNLAYLTKSGQLTPLKQGTRETLFLTGEVERAGW